MGIHGFLIEESETKRNRIDEKLRRIGMNRDSKTDADILLQLIDEVDKLRDNKKLDRDICKGTLGGLID